MPSRQDEEQVEYLFSLISDGLANAQLDEERLSEDKIVQVLGHVAQLETLLGEPPATRERLTLPKAELNQAREAIRAGEADKATRLLQEAAWHFEDAQRDAPAARVFIAGSGGIAPPPSVVEPLREYRATIFVKQSSGLHRAVRVSVNARSLNEARQLLEREHGVGEVHDLHNPEDAETAR